MVYEVLGKEVLDNAWQGYHCCLFAYGQTGSGKSYSMLGYEVNRGIVPLVTEEIFTRIGDSQGNGKSFEVSLSMVEIYNEKVQDLFLDPKLRPKEGLKIRQSAVLGVYIEGLKKTPVGSYRDIEKAMTNGNKNRSIGATLMNATSSRAHTIITIEFKQITEASGTKTEKFS
jgi:hypothetical protein